MTSTTRTQMACKGAVAVRRRSRLAHWLLVTIAALMLWLLSAPKLHAQTLYEWREPGGSVAYSQAPPRPQDGVLLRRIDLPTLVPDARRAATRVLAHSSAPQTTAAVSLRRADASVSKALAALQAAERALRHGQVPQPGERRHLVNGHSRLTQAYFDRISALEAAVTSARDALAAAYTARDNLASTMAQR